VLFSFECKTSALTDVVKFTMYSNRYCTEGGTVEFYVDFGDISSDEVCPDENQCNES